MAENKTKANTSSVDDFINSISDDIKRKDSVALIEIMKNVTGEEPKMWGPSIIGFGNVKLKSPNTGKEVDWLRIGFSPRKANLSLYISGDINQQNEEALKKLGKHKTGVGCLYINKLEDVDLKILQEMMKASLSMEYFSK